MKTTNFTEEEIQLTKNNTSILATLISGTQKQKSNVKHLTHVGICQTVNGQFVVPFLEHPHAITGLRRCNQGCIHFTETAIGGVIDKSTNNGDLTKTIEAYNWNAFTYLSLTGRDISVFEAIIEL